MKKIIVLAILSFSALALAQENDAPQVANGKVISRPISGPLATVIADIAKTQQAAWIAYSVPLVPGERHMCCFYERYEFRRNGRCCGGCRLESGSQQGMMIGDRIQGCPNPASGNFFVLARVAKGEVEKIRPASVDCGLDFGGLNVYWLGAAVPKESIAWLAGFIMPGNWRDSGEEALTALALHNDPAADDALAKFVAPNQDEGIREQASFWLGSAGGRRGFEILRDVVRRDNDPKFREDATAGFAESHEPEAQQELIRIAHQDPDGDVRGQALFWLAQKAGKKVAGTLTNAIENDPDTDVKKKAVFAVSQMEDGQAVPLLIQLAKSNRSPVVRKEAIFWLGQSEDPRALDYIESILK